MEYIDLTEDEKILIAKHLDFYRSLDEGRREPTTPAQQHFVKMCTFQAGAKTDHEMAYAKYRRNAAISAHDRQDHDHNETSQAIPEFEEGAPRSEFGTREDHKSDSGRTWSDSTRDRVT